MTKRTGLIPACFALLVATLATVVPAANAASTSARAPKPPPPAGTGKAVPVRPRTAPGVATGAALPAKPPRPAGTAAPLAAAAEWTVTLTADRTLLWPTEFVNLTATTNIDVGPTPFYLRIYSVFEGQYIASCGVGTVCPIAVTDPVATRRRYVAVVSDGSTGFPPAVEQARSTDVDVDFATLVDKLNLKLHAQANTVAVGGSATITATLAEDLSGSPFTVQIYDEHTLIAQCGSGLSCSARVSQPTATTHMFAAYVASSVDTFPTGQQPRGTQRTAGFMYVTWADTGWRASLAASPVVGDMQTVTATASGDVGPTPYYIEIFSLPTDTRLAVCSGGSTCTATIPANTPDVQAFVTTLTEEAFPFPAGVSVQASSNVVNG